MADARTVRPGEAVTYHNAPETGPAHDAVLVKKRERPRSAPATVLVELTLAEAILLDAVLSSHEDSCAENLGSGDEEKTAARDLALVQSIRAELAAARSARLAGKDRKRVFPRRK
jgi:hypothetical protein